MVAEKGAYEDLAEAELGIDRKKDPFWRGGSYYPAA